MKCGKTFEEFEALNGISVEEILSVFEAVSQAYPMIVSANLTKNTYTMIKDDGFLAGNLPASGRFDDLIDFGVEFIHPNYQSVFLEQLQAIIRISVLKIIWIHRFILRATVVVV